MRHLSHRNLFFELNTSLLRVSAPPREHGTRLDHKRREGAGRCEMGQSPTSSVIERRFEILLGGVAEELLHVGIQRDGGSHGGIIMRSFITVKMPAWYATCVSGVE